MSLISFIVLAFAFGLSAMLLMRNCADASPIRLSSGLLVSFTLAVVHTALFCLGIDLGDLFSFSTPQGAPFVVNTNAYIFLGVAIILVIKMLLPYLGSKPRSAVFDLNAGTFRVLLFTVATGINCFLAGFGVGFVAPLSNNLHAALWPMLIVLFLFSFLGIMFGRQHVVIRPRRWTIASAVFVLATAIVAVITAG